MDLRFAGVTVGNFTKDFETFVVKQTFKLPQSEGPGMKQLNDLDMNTKLFLALNCGDTMYQLGYVQIEKYTRDNKGGYVLILRSNSKAYNQPPDELGNQEVEMLLVEPADLDAMLKELGFENILLEDNLGDGTEAALEETEV